MTAPLLAVVGGSGFYENEALGASERIEVDTPYGQPSDTIVLGTLGGARTAFLARHGARHRLLPSELPSRANIWALASLGVERILSVSAVGSLKESIAPRDIVVPDQIIDRTSGRPATFFGNGIAAHISFADPFCPALSAALAAVAADDGGALHAGGTMVVIEGPAFSTRAESAQYRSWGADIIGMTACPEARLAREAGICYATLACVTDYDTWHGDHETVSVELVVGNLRANIGRAKAIAEALAGALGTLGSCGCRDALRDAIITPLSAVPTHRRRELAPILARVAEVAS
jgi:5'-methylthioadenosine phosphorylase